MISVGTTAKENKAMKGQRGIGDLYTMAREGNRPPL